MFHGQPNFPIESLDFLFGSPREASYSAGQEKHPALVDRLPRMKVLGLLSLGFRENDARLGMCLPLAYDECSPGAVLSHWIVLVKWAYVGTKEEFFSVEPPLQNFRSFGILSWVPKFFSKLSSRFPTGSFSPKGRYSISHIFTRGYQFCRS
jgi:hypothetical protein